MHHYPRRDARSLPREVSTAHVQGNKNARHTMVPVALHGSECFPHRLGIAC